MMPRMNARLRQSWLIVLLVAAGAALRLYFVRWHPGVSGDSLLYGDLAQNMLHHHVYGFTEGAKIRPTLIRLPGYPLFLALCFAVAGVGNYMAVVWAQFVLDLMGWWWLSRLAARLFGERAGVAVLALGMLCPFTANYVAIPLTETLVMFCAIVALVGFERWLAHGAGWSAWIWGIAAALVYGVMLRPDQGLLGVVVVAAMAWVSWKRGEWKAVAAICAVIALPFLLWGMRNERVMHAFQPLAPRFAEDPGEFVSYGFNKWYRTWAIEFKATNDFYWNWDTDQVSMADLPARAIDSAKQGAETAKAVAMYDAQGHATPQVDALMMQLANERVKAKPFRYYVYVPAMKVANMWLRPRTELMNLPIDWWDFRAHEKGSWQALGLAMWNAAYLLLAVVGFWKWKRDGLSVMGVVCIAFVLLRCALLWTIDNSEPRYTLECFPMVMLWGAYVFRRRAQISD